jgi:hypothetical protein
MGERERRRQKGWCAQGDRRGFDNPRWGGGHVFAVCSIRNRHLFSRVQRKNKDLCLAGKEKGACQSHTSVESCQRKASNYYKSDARTQNVWY